MNCLNLFLKGSPSPMQERSVPPPLTFNGTEGWIYGTNRSDRGPYGVIFGGGLHQGNASHDDQISQQVLFPAVDSDATKPHAMLIVNSRTDVARPYLDVDSVSAFS